MNELIFHNDPYRMNWLREDYEYARIICPGSLTAKVSHEATACGLRTRVTLTNHTDKPVFTGAESIAIQLPLQDRYESAGICMTHRCHVHLYCGLDISYACALRMGGDAPHLGLVLTEGSLGSYSIQRDLKHASNDRGCFLLHPVPMVLAPGAQHSIAWEIFPHGGWADFFAKARKIRHFLQAEASRYVLFPGETATVKLLPSWPAQRIAVNGESLAADASGEYVLPVVHSPGEPLGERVLEIAADGIITRCTLLFHASPNMLAEKRCAFLVAHQQYHGDITGLQGAFLAYDNEEEHIFYSAEYDYNGGRERVCMGLLMIRQIMETDADAPERTQLLNSLHAYEAYVLRELVDENTGDVFNDFGRDNSYERLYNLPWFATFFTDLYQLAGDPHRLEIACCIVRRYYELGGLYHYPIELPILSLCRALTQAGMIALADEMTALFRAHGQQIIRTGLCYPPSEVNYEQSIVAPATSVLLQLAVLTRDITFLHAGEQQLEVLTLFNGEQPDYHLHQTAIRHWDGYWFGKRRIYGDTFPHYWSGLTGQCLVLHHLLTGDERSRKQAQASLRGVLPLISPEGRGSCAYRFPQKVNDIPAHGFDPCANDQDWALYFYLRMLQEAPLVLQ